MASMHDYQEPVITDSPNKAAGDKPLILTEPLA